MAVLLKSHLWAFTAGLGIGSGMVVARLWLLPVEKDPAPPPERPPSSFSAVLPAPTGSPPIWSPSSVPLVATAPFDPLTVCVQPGVADRNRCRQWLADCYQQLYCAQQQRRIGELDAAVRRCGVTVGGRWPRIWQWAVSDDAWWQSVLTQSRSSCR